MSRFGIIFIFLLSLASQTLFALESSALLPPEQAFQASAKAVRPDQIEITWTISKNYSLYRKNMRFEAKSPDIQLGDAAFPRGKVKHDETLGDIEHYREQLKVQLPITATKASSSFQLLVRYQGCADIGVCYPPQEKTLDVARPASFVAAAMSPVDSLVKGLSGLGPNSSQAELLPPEQAFQFTAATKDPNTIHVSWLPAEGYYLYREKFKLALIGSDKVKLGDYVIPHGEPKEDEAFGHVEIFHGEVSVDIPLIRSDTAPQHLSLKADYQGCADRGVCYPPMDKTVELDLPAATATSLPNNPSQQTAPLSEQDQITQSLHNDSLWVTLVSFFGFGLLLSLTPCVFPMIPILSGIIVGKGHSINTARAFLLSLSYVVASAFTYTIFGVLAALFGGNLQAVFQEPWIIALFSGIFVLLSLSMFGFYSLELPDFIRAKLHNSSEKHRDGSILGAAIMGALSSLIVGPCVAAPLAGALIYIGQTGDVALGGSALFVMGMGMGVPLLAMGASAGKLLPKAGTWLNATNAVFGVLMLGVAVWMLSRILPPEITMLLWALLLILPAIYLNAVDSLPEHSSGWRKLWKGVGITMLAYGLLLLIGFSIGNSNPLKPLQGFGITAKNAQNANDEGIRFERVASLAELENRIKQANANNQPVMLDFYADWCISCKEMEAYTFTDAKVKQALVGFVLLQADVTKQSEEDKALLTKFNLIGPPAILFFAGAQQEKQALRVIGYQDALTFIKTLKQVKS
ncbi:thiol:disulfide interchange protein DsbD [Methyloglobulus morosus KoM1]|uniref:Thiol:disulfide interchange protein DsbD n=1 Tax=Methyloglobulus morosus KoM1 TaxID=1116472 RepID=V5BMZ0_9GAMM|nr:protein-disulfide reductase DsbD [Methyloglobulus morosus]ESS69164.1 thiol:disulfide interchange protein DsbD [Methyloglobulus morosus KoM1]